MKKTNDNLILLNIIFAVCLVISNIVASKLLYTGLFIFGIEITIPCAVFCYPITFLVTDIIGELWGKDEANKTVCFCLVGQIIASILILFVQILPCSNQNVQDAYKILLGQNWIFVLASLLAYIASQSWDVWVFHKIRKKCLSKNENMRHQRWIWNNASTMTSQIIDTVIFIGIAFGLGFKWLFAAETRKILFVMMFAQYILKFILALIDTPFFYLFTHRKTEIKE